MAWEDPLKDAVIARGRLEAAIREGPHPLPPQTEEALAAAWDRAAERVWRETGSYAGVRAALRMLSCAALRMLSRAAARRPLPRPGGAPPLEPAAPADA